MASAKANPLWIGIFVVGAAVLGATAVILFGSGRLFEQRNEYVSFFDNSVTGLDVGAPVIFRGVDIGEVTKIDAIIESDNFHVAVPVYFETVVGRIQVTGERQLGAAGLRAFIDAGLRAQLRTQSFITGKLYLDLDLHPDTPIDYKGIDPDVFEIPTVPTELQQLQRDARAIFQKIGELPLEDIVVRIASAADSLDALLKKPELADAIDELDGTLTEAKRLVGRVEERFDGLADGADVTMRELRSTIRQARTVLVSADDALEPGSPLRYQVMSTLKELEGAAESLRLLADELGRQPEGLLFGRSAKEDDK